MVLLLPAFTRGPPKIDADGNVVAEGTGIMASVTVAIRYLAFLALYGRAKRESWETCVRWTHWVDNLQTFKLIIWSMHLVYAAACHIWSLIDGKLKYCIFLLRPPHVKKIV